jgi:hypothetical protein
MQSTYMIAAPAMRHPLSTCIAGRIRYNHAHGDWNADRETGTMSDTDRVVLRRWRTGLEQPQGEIIALFPDIPSGSGLVMSYETVGGHGPASWPSVIAQTDPVPTGCDDGMVEELRRLGYNPAVYLRRPTR